MAEGQGIIGDNVVTELPETKVEQQSLVEEQKMAKYSRSAEFKRIKQWAEERIEFYQQFLPNGQPVIDTVPTPDQWIAANAIIAELTYLTKTYEQVNDAVQQSKLP
jgi:predicted nucleic acid-binding protein